MKLNIQDKKKWPNYSGGITSSGDTLHFQESDEKTENEVPEQTKDYKDSKYYSSNNLEVVDNNKGKNFIAIGLPKGAIENMVTSGDGSIEGLKLARIEQKENFYTLRLENSTTSVEMNCGRFRAYTPHFSGSYLESENDMVILLDPSSLNIDNFYVKRFGKDQKDVEKKQSEGHLKELSVNDSQLIIGIDVDSIKNTLSRFNPVRCMIDPIFADVLKGKTRVELPINDVLFSGRALNELQSSMESNKTQVEGVETEPSTGLETVNTHHPAGKKGTGGLKVSPI